MEQQIAKKSLQVMTYRVGVATHSLSNDVKMYCEKLFCKSRLTQSVEVKDGMTFFGSGTHHKDACIAKGTKYNKCIYKGQLYQSKSYTRSKRWNNSIVQLKSGKIVQIFEIISLPDTGCYFYVNEFIIEKFVIGQVKIPHMWKIRSLETNNRLLVPIVNVASKMVLIDFGVQPYVCSIANLFEAD